MASQTWAELINLALRDSGVAAAGQTPSAQMQNDAKMRANMMIGAWKRRRWMVYHLIDVSCLCTGATSYGVGPGQPLNTPRTDQIESAYIRQVVPAGPTPVDFPLRVIRAREDYSRLTLKGLVSSPPDVLFFDSGYPTGLAFPWPIPSSAWELHIVVKGLLDSVGNFTDTINLPDEYQDALYSNLCVRLCSAFRIPADPMMVSLAKSSLRTIKAANTQVPTMQMPQSVRRRGRTYNVFSDQS